MTQTDRRRSNRSRWSMMGLGGVVILSSVLLANGGLPFNLSSEGIDAGRKPTGYPQLVSVEPLPEVAMGGEMCASVPAPSPVLLTAALRQDFRPRADRHGGFYRERTLGAVASRVATKCAPRRTADECKSPQLRTGGGSGSLTPARPAVRSASWSGLSPGLSLRA